MPCDIREDAISGQRGAPAPNEGKTPHGDFGLISTAECEKWQSLICMSVLTWSGLRVVEEFVQLARSCAAPT